MKLLIAMTFMASMLFIGGTSAADEAAAMRLWQSSKLEHGQLAFAQVEPTPVDVAPSASIEERENVVIDQIHSLLESMSESERSELLRPYSPRGGASSEQIERLRALIVSIRSANERVDALESGLDVIASRVSDLEWRQQQFVVALGELQRLQGERAAQIAQLKLKLADLDVQLASAQSRADGLHSGLLQAQAQTRSAIAQAQAAQAEANKGPLRSLFSGLFGG